MSALSSYDRIAADYAAGIDSGSPVHAVSTPALLELVGDGRGLAIADLACGSGWATRLLAAAGANVTGIDLSEEMLEIAEAEEAARGVASQFSSAGSSMELLPVAANDESVHDLTSQVCQPQPPIRLRSIKANQAPAQGPMSRVSPRNIPIEPLAVAADGEVWECGNQLTAVDCCTEPLDSGSCSDPAPRGRVRYLRADICRMPEVSDGAFEGAVSSLALMDIAELESCLAEVRRIVRPGGWFVFTITHPCFQGPECRWTGKAGGTIKREVRGYFREGWWQSDNPHGIRGRVGAHHRTLSTYLNALIAAGFTIERVAEPQPLNEVAARVPGYAEVPVVLAVRCEAATRSHA